MHSEDSQVTQADPIFERDTIHRSWWHIAVGGPIVRRVIEEAGASGIDVLIIARRELPPAEALEPSAANES